jgi:hypothetical protein
MEKLDEKKGTYYLEKFRPQFQNLSPLDRTQNKILPKKKRSKAFLPKHNARIGCQLQQSNVSLLGGSETKHSVINLRAMDIYLSESLRVHPYQRL